MGLNFKLIKAPCQFELFRGGERKNEKVGSEEEAEELV